MNNWMTDSFRQRLTFVTPPRAPVKIVFGERSNRGVQRFDHPRIVTDHEPSAKMLREQWPEARGVKRDNDWYLDLPQETVLPIIVDERNTQFRFEERDNSGYLIGSCDGSTYLDLTTRTRKPCSCSMAEASRCRPSVGLRGSLMLPTVGRLVSVWQGSHAANFARELATVPEGNDPLVIGVRLVTMRAVMKTANGASQSINTVRPSLFYALRMPKAELRELLAEKRSLDDLTKLLAEHEAFSRYGLLDTELEPELEPELEQEHIGSVIALSNVNVEEEIVLDNAIPEATTLIDEYDDIDVDADDGIDLEPDDDVDTNVDANDLIEEVDEMVAEPAALFGKEDPKPSLPPLRRNRRTVR